MQDRKTFFPYARVVSLFLLLAGIAAIVQAQDQEPMVIQATAIGTSTQMGKMVNVNIHIDQFSTQEDRKALIDAFKRSGQDGLVDALDHMKGKGRFSTPYGVGNEVKYIIELPADKGRRHIRLITDRRISFGEAYASTRSKEYSVGGIELFLTTGGKDSEGTALPACKLKIGKKTQQLEIETYQNPWKLTNLRISKK
ncbi:MAG: hypothetical protein ACXVKH_13225 [Candidatus Angelobacter sp.]